MIRTLPKGLQLGPGPSGSPPAPMPGPVVGHLAFGAPRWGSLPILDVLNRRGQDSVTKPPSVDKINPYFAHSSHTYLPPGSGVPFGVVSKLIVTKTPTVHTGVGVDGVG